jgi:hypothetical protein
MKKEILEYLKAIGVFIGIAITFFWLIGCLVLSLGGATEAGWKITLGMFTPAILIVIYAIKQQITKKHD